MKLLQIYLPEECLATMTDAELGAFTRTKLQAEKDAREAAKAKGKAAVIAKLGHKIEIDGVSYGSRAQAREALGLNHKQFAAKYPSQS